ncbi:membrane protein [soil metagenome]
MVLASRAYAHGALVPWNLIAAWGAHVCLVWLTVLLVYHFPGRFESAGDAPGGIADLFAAWDGSHYTWIAANGYSTEGNEIRRFAFFPLFPLIAHLLGGGKHTVIAGVVFNQILLLGSALLLGQLVRPGKERNADLLSQPGFWLLISPLAFFFSVFYSESLFLFLGLAGTVAYTRGRYDVAIPALVLAGLTRPTAICLAAIFLCDAAIRLRNRRKVVVALACAAAPVLGILIYWAAVAYSTGNLMGYFQIQSTIWGHSWTAPFLPFLQDARATVARFLDGSLRLPDQNLRLLSTLIILSVFAAGWRRLDAPLLFFVLVSMIFIHSQEPNRSTARYELAIFPLYLLLPPARAKLFPAVIAVAFILLQIRWLLEFLAWRWVA